MFSFDWGTFMILSIIATILGILLAVVILKEIFIPKKFIPKED